MLRGCTWKARVNMQQSALSTSSSDPVSPATAVFAHRSPGAPTVFLLSLEEMLHNNTLFGYSLSRVLGEGHWLLMAAALITTIIQITFRQPSLGPTNGAYTLARCTFPISLPKLNCTFFTVTPLGASTPRVILVVVVSRSIFSQPAVLCLATAFARPS